MKLSIKFVYLLLIYLCSECISYAGLHYENSQRNPYPYVISILSKSCNSNLFYGTGIIAKHNNIYYIITAAHVAIHMEEESVVRVASSSKSHTAINLIDIVNDSIINWKYHDVADMAIIEIPNIDTYDENGFKNFISSDMFLSNIEGIAIGDNFLHVGFPLGFPLSYQSNSAFSPYVYKTYALNIVMEIPQVVYPNNVDNLICVSPCSYSGSSGGPLLSDECELGNFHIVGINHGLIWESVINNPVMSLFTPMCYFFDIAKN